MKNASTQRHSRGAACGHRQLAVAGVIAGAGGIAAVPADAAASHKADKQLVSARSHFERPELRHGTLMVKGTRASDRIALRLKAGRPDILQVDVGDDGSADFSVKRRFVARIVVDARAGDDLVRIDESNGVFTDTIPTTLDGGDGDDNLAGGTGVEKLRGGAGNDTIDGNGGNDVALMGSGDDTFVWDPGDGSDTVEGQTGTDTMALQRRRRRGARRPVGQREPAAVLPRRRQHHHGHQRRRDGRLQRARRRRRDHRQRPHRHRCPHRQRRPRRHARRRHRRRPTDSVVVNGTKRNDTIDVSGDATGVAASGLTTRVAIQHQEPERRARRQRSRRQRHDLGGRTSRPRRSP